MLLGLAASSMNIDSLINELAERIAQKVAERCAPSKPRTVKLLYSEKEVAKMLGLSVAFLKKSRQEGYIVAATRKRPIVYSEVNIQQIAKWLGER